MILAHRRDLLALAATLLVMTPTAPSPVCAQEQSPGQSRVWRVKGSSTRLWIEEGMLVSATEREITESIPLSTIKALTYETTSEHPAVGEIRAWVEDLWDSISPDAGEAIGFIFFPMVAGATIPSLFLPFKTTRHLIYVEWKREGKDENRVYLLSKSDAHSLMNELRRATGLQWSNSGEIGRSNRGALENSSARREDSVGRHEHGRLVFVDRGYSIPSIEIVPIQAAPADCGSASDDLDARIEEARRNLEETEREQGSRLNPPAPQSTKPTLRIPTSQLQITALLSEMKPCRGPASELSTEMK